MSRSLSPAARWILVLNTAGFAAYAFWLVIASNAIFYTQDGVLYLLPGLPFFFVYAYLLGRADPPKAEGESDGKGS